MSSSDFKPADSASTSDFEASPTLHESPRKRKSRPSSRRSSTHGLSSPLKRRRLASKSAEPDAKQHLSGHYNDGYRVLFNENVASAARRFTVDYADSLYQGQVGVSRWSKEDKSLLFSAVERLGRDNLPAIAEAVGTKSIPEVQEFLLLLQDAGDEVGKPSTLFRDVPAAAEVSHACCERLDLAGDAMAWYQERFEAKEEQERYGEYWLITPELAQRIEDAMRPSRAPSLASSPPIADVQLEHSTQYAESHMIQNIPAAELLDAKMMLQLSTTVFMNCHPNFPSLGTHWTELTSPIADSPSIYHTALADFRTLVVSLTKRLVQASIIQATSRIRSQGWRGKKKAAGLFVKARDVRATADVLRLPPNSHERWKGVARRCGLHVFEEDGRVKREVPWDEVEDVLNEPGKLRHSSADTDGGTPGAGSDTAGDDFKSRAGRGATPLPERLSSSSNELSDVRDSEYDDEDPKAGPQIDGTPFSSAPSSPKSPKKHVRTLSEREIYQKLEDFDRQTSREEEARLWALLGMEPPPQIDNVLDAEEPDDLDTTLQSYDLEAREKWREFTRYRAEWEEFGKPVPASAFRANRKNMRFRYEQPATANAGINIKVETDASSDIGSEEEEARTPRPKRRKARAPELPIRSARAYAEHQDRFPASLDRDDEDNEDEPLQSIEGTQGSGSISGSLPERPVFTAQDPSDILDSSAESDFERDPQKTVGSASMSASAESSPARPIFSTQDHDDLMDYDAKPALPQNMPEPASSAARGLSMNLNAKRSTRNNLPRPTSTAQDHSSTNYAGARLTLASLKERDRAPKVEDEEEDARTDVLEDIDFDSFM